MNPLLGDRGSECRSMFLVVKSSIVGGLLVTCKAVKLSSKCGLVDAEILAWHNQIHPENFWLRFNFHVQQRQSSPSIPNHQPEVCRYSGPLQLALDEQSNSATWIVAFPPRTELDTLHLSRHELKNP